MGDFFKLFFSSYAAVALPLLVGVMWLFQLQQLPPAAWSLLLLPLWVLTSRKPRLRPLFWLLLGFLWSAFQAELLLSHTLPERAEGRDLQLVGVVEGVPERRSSGSLRFLFRIEQAHLKGEPLQFPAQVRLNWYRTEQSLQAGQRWSLTVRLKQPHGFSNPAGFDWERWLFEKRIRATGYVRKGENRLLTASTERINPLRQRLSSWIQSIDSSGIVAALVVGDRQGIDAEQWQVLRQTGTSHLMAISGLHIGLIATLMFLLFRWIWSLYPQLLLTLPAQQVGAVGAISGALAYATLAGFSVPTQRALIMVSVVMLMLLLRRALTPWRGYFAAMSVVLLYDPLAALSPGFWLSFGAVGWILYGMPERESRRSTVWVMVQLQGVLLVGMLPLLLYLFQQGSLVAPIANLLVVPWVSLLVVPLALLAALLQLLSIPGADWLLLWSSQLLQWSWPLLQWLSDLPLSNFSVAAPSLWMVLLALAGVAAALSRALSRSIGAWRWLGLAALLPLLLWPQPRPDEGEAWVTLLDVGQGLAVVVESREQVMVYDTGDRFSSTFDAGSAVVAPFLRSRGWKQIDLLIVGHDDRDHIGGMAALLQQFPVVEARSSIPQKVPQSQPCLAGEQWHWSGLRMELLHPHAGSHLTGNDRSCVLRIEAGGESLLLTGDIEQPAEHALLQNSRTKIDVDTVVVPHHGSHTSSTLEWIEAVSPRWALIPVGYLNRYRLPREAVVERYRAIGAQVLSSADEGAIEIRLGEHKAPAAWRRNNHHLWSDLPQ